jgi:hypothetical protein
MREPTHEDITELLYDPAGPRGRGVEEQVIPVLGFIAFVRSRGFATSHVEELVDDCVRQLGGERHHVVDPASWFPNLLRRLTGNLPSRHEDVWLLPPKT